MTLVFISVIELYDHDDIEDFIRPLCRFHQLSHWYYFAGQDISLQKQYTTKCDEDEISWKIISNKYQFITKDLFIGSLREKTSFFIKYSQLFLTVVNFLFWLLYRPIG